jgi:hypothetical protein
MAVREPQEERGAEDCIIGNKSQIIRQSWPFLAVTVACKAHEHAELQIEN